MTPPGAGGGKAGLSITELLKALVEANAEFTTIYMEDCGIADGDDLCVIAARGQGAKDIREWVRSQEAEQ